MSDDLRKLAEAATPGPWGTEYDGMRVDAMVYVARHDNNSQVCSTHNPHDGEHGHKEDNANAEYIAAANPTAILALLDHLAAVEAERDEAFDRGRAVGREDVGKYSHAIGQIEGVLGIAGAVPLGETVEAVRRLRAERDAARAEVERLRLSPEVVMTMTSPAPPKPRRIAKSIGIDAGFGEVLWELWPWCLAHNLAVAGGLEFARLCGFHMGMSDDHPMNWHPMDRRPAPGWGGDE